MKEFYTFEGQSYEVDPSRLEEFLGQFPNATKVGEPGKTIDPASNVMDSGSENGGLESRLPFSYSDDSKTQVLLQKEETTVDSQGNESKNLVVNKEFFDLEDEVAVSQLKAQFGDAFDFEEMRFGKFKGAGVSMSGVTVSTKDGKKSKTIEFNIDGRDQATDEMINSALEKQKNDPNSLNNIDKRVLRQLEDNKNAYEVAYSDLVSFMDENSTEETRTATNVKEQEIRKTVGDFNNYVKQDVEAIENKYSEETQPNMFNPVEEEVTQRFAYGMEAKGGGGSRTYTKVIQPYEEELKLAMTRLGVNEITQEVKDEARNIVIENERRSLKEAKTTEMLEELEDGEILPASLAEYKDDPDALKSVLTVGNKMFQREYAVKTEAFIREKHELETGEDILAFTNLSKQLNDPEYNFEIQSDEPVVTLEDGRLIPKRILDQHEKERLRLKPKYENFFKLQNDLIDNRYNIQDSDTQLDLLRRDYNDWERFGVTVGAGFAELAINIGGATEDIEAHKRWAKVKAELQEKRDEYAKPIAYDDAFKSWTNFGKFAVGELGNQIPIFTALAVPYAGWGTLLASSYGEQYGTMTAEEIASKDSPFGEIDYSLFEKMATSAGYAVPELAFELVTTVPLLRGAGNSLKGLYGSSIRDLTKQGVKEGIRDNTPGFIKGSLFGSLGEGATTLTQNVVTGKPWHENVEHSLFSGLMFESTLAAVPTIAGAVTNKLSDYDQNAKVRENLTVVNSIIQANKILKTRIKFGKKLNKDTELLESDKKNNENKIKDLLADNTKILGEQKQGITGRWLGWGKNNKNGMSAGAFKAYLNVTTQQEQLRIQADKIINSDYTDAEKSKKLKELKENGFTDASGKKYNGFDLLQGARDAFRSEKNSEFNLWKADKNNEKKLNEYLENAQDFIDNPNTDRSPNWVKGKDADDVARILFNIDKINENLNIARDKKGRPTALDKNLVVYDDVKTAVVEMAKLGIDNKVIQSVKDGSHGFDGPNDQSYIIVENMAKDDRLETKTHELSHRFFRNAIAENPEAFREMSETIFEWSKTNDKQLYARLLRQAMTVDSAPDEIIAVFLEEAAAERIDLKKKGIAGLIGYMTGNIMQEGYGVDMDFAGESDAIKMLIGLGKKIKAGKLTLKDQEAIVKSEVFETAKRKGKILDLFMPKVPGATKLSKAEGSQTTIKEDLFTEANNALIEALEMYGMDRPERLLSEDIEVRKELAKEWEALGDSRFWVGVVIGEKWKKFLEVNYLQKRDKAANYNLYKDQILDVAATGIEKGDNGIPFLVRSWKPAEEGGRTLTSHIFGEIGTRLMGTNGIIDRKFPQFDKFTSVIDASFDEGGMDIEGDLDIDAVLAAEERKRKRKENLEEDRYRKLIGVDDKFAAEIKKEIRDVLLSGNLGLISDFAWTQRFSKAAQKKLFTIIKKEMKDYEAFLKKTRKPFVKHANTSDLVQMEKREEKKIFTTLKAVNASPNKIKLALLEGLIQPFEVKSMTQGPNIYDKVDAKEQEFIDFMKVRGRKDAFVKSNINIMAMDAVFDVLLNETIEVDGKQVRVLDEFIRQQREKGLPHVSNVLSIVKERINRDQDVKFSSTVRNFNNLDLRVFYGKLNTFGNKIDLINVGDEDAVRLAVEETWGDDYGKTVIKALSKDLFKLVKRYATIDKNHTNLKTQPEQKLNEYLYDNLKAAELELNLAEYLELKDEDGKLMKFSELFDDTGRLNNQRSAIIDFGKKLVEKYKPEKALMMMIHAGGMYSTSTQISRGNHLVNDSGKIYKITEDQITKLDKEGKRKTQFSSQRYQSFTGKKDWNVNVMQVVFPELKFTRAKNLEKFQIIDGKKIDTSLLAESSKKGMEDRNFTAREAQAKLSEEFVRDIAQYYKDNKALDKIDFGMLMMSMSSNMQSPLKRAANLKYIYKDKKGKKYKGEFRYEHMIPTNFMVLKITDAYMNDKSDVDLDALFKEYTVAIIPVTMDNIMEEMNFINTMPIVFEAGQSSRIRYYNMSTFGHPDLYAIESIDPKDKGRVYGEGATVKFSKNIKNTKIINDAIVKARTVKFSQTSRGITVLDFDDTLATSKSLVISTSPEGVVRKLTAEEFAQEGADLLDQGWTHDFSEFSKVVDGKVASLFKKAMKLQGKFGPENMFVLTARPADSAPAIFEFLKANGLNIPLKNITGLANSTSEAKALWIADKVGEGYNDFYFADDALQNVQAVKNMLDQFDVKSKVQQAKVKFSKSMNDKFNDILENVTGIESDKRFSIIKGRKRGESKGKFRFFIPPSHEDFVGLLYNFLGKGKEGNAHRDFFEQALIRPLNRANREYDTARQSVANDYKELNKQFEDVRKKLTKKTADGDFTFQDAIRVYLWDKHGHKIPGLSETDQIKLVELVASDPQLQAYAETLNVISKQETYVNPTDGWNSGDIRMDLDDATGRIGRKQFFAEFIENADVIFSEENLNKIEAGYGKGVRESLEDMLYRIETGRNRPTGQNKQVNNLMNYLNGSVGTVMFFNMRSALLQQMSIVNYINFADNNIFAAAKAFANQKQYWKDFAFIFNSDMLKQRRGGIQTDINGAELAASLRNSKDITRKLISKLLEIGFLPTQIGDNIAIATGGASYYRNRINKYVKQGMSQKEAEAAAFTDFQDITQSTQQSARPDMVSKQQASVIGKVILNFQNVTSQFNRLGKKAFQDIYNRRITKPNSTQMQSDISNAARITYYFAIQNAIFYTLQTALFAMMFDDDEEDVNNLFIKKQERLINGSIDSVLRGSGLIGGVVATLKNVAIAFARQRDVKYNPDESAVGLEALNLSPVLGIKLRKIVNAEKTLNYNKKVIKEMETFDIDNPQWSAVTNYTEAFTNIPLNRLYNKTQNVRQSLNNDHAAWERTLMFLGWSQYNLDLENKKMEEIKEKTKGKKKKSKKSKTYRILK